MGEHRLRLNLANADQFWCPINKFALAPGFRLEGTLPLGVNLKYIQVGVATGKLIDINGTVLGGGKKHDDLNNDVAFTGQSENQEKPELGDGALQEGGVQPTGTESDDSGDSEGESAAKTDDQKEEQVDPPVDVEEKQVEPPADAEKPDAQSGKEAADKGKKTNKKGK